MLNTTRLFAMKLAFLYAALMSAGLRQSARLASAYQERNGISVSGCRFQNSRSVPSATIRMGDCTMLPQWEQATLSGLDDPSTKINHAGAMFQASRTGRSEE